MRTTNYGNDHPFAIVRGRVAGPAAVGTATLQTIALVIISPSQLTANTDNWNPTGLSTASVIRASTDASRNLTGITAPSDDRLLILANIGAQDLVLKHDVTSTAANRFYCPDNSDVTLGANTWTWLLYDLTSARWRVLGAGAGSIPAGTYVLTTEGGQETINAIGTSGATEDIDPTLGNIWTATLGDDTVFTILAPVGSGGATLEGWISTGAGGFTPDFAASGGTWTWDGATPTLDTTAGVTYRIVAERIPGTSNDWVGNLVGGGSASPLTTKGDLWGFSTVDARVPVGTDGQVLTADSTAALGVSWQTPTVGVGEILISDTPSTPLVFADLIQNEAQDDLVYADP